MRSVHFTDEDEETALRLRAFRPSVHAGWTQVFPTALCGCYAGC